MSEVAADPISRLTQARQRLLAEARPGMEAARELTRITDEAVSALAEAAFAGSGHQWAVLATGSYGAGRLLPYSDVDIVVIVRSRPRRSDEAIRGLLYPLWDAGLDIGYAVRTPSQQRSACRNDIETLTALVPGRAVAGDLALADAVKRACLSDARARRGGIGRALSSRVRTGTPFDLWPDLKNGAGGQRDLDELAWREALLGTPAPDLRTEQETLLAARWALHAVAGRSASSLSPDHGSIASGRLHEAMGRIAAALAVARGELSADITSGEPIDADAVLDACERGDEEFDALALAALSGALDDIVPGMSFLMTLRRPALGHRYTVGAHCIKAALAVNAIHDRDPLARTLCPPERLPTVVAAALAHDAGKAVPGPSHADRSAGPAAHAALGLTRSDAEALDAAWLAREHLLLSTFAERADIDDDDVVLACAARIPRAELLGPLYVLTAADYASIGSGSWDSWHASLVQTLARRLDAVFHGDRPLRHDALRAEEVRAAAAALLAREPAALVALSRFPSRALYDRTPEQAAEDARSVARLSDADHGRRFDASVTVGPAPETFSLRISSAWRPRLLEEAAGCCTLVGLDILDARLLADAGDLTLTALVVRSAARTPVDHDTWLRLDRLLSRAFEGELDIATRLAAGGRAPAAPQTLRVEWGVDDPAASVLHVETDDRPGLLFSLARAVHDAGLVILSARAIVRDGIAIDTLRVVDEDGTPVKSPGRLGHLAMQIRESLTQT
ncbi:MAG: nucleotidyltransferase domain-containing protein [Coriobacteriia bacterium]|nr:nucleotidyltransferase domain-containing protein [Coriobacteriia bacterium]